MTWEGRIFLEVSSADPDSDTPVWVDLTSRIRDNVQPISLNTGRQNDLDTSEPSVLQVLLDNSDDALTYGNTAGPYPWWAAGRRIRYREVIAGVNVPLFDGFITQINETVTTRAIEQRLMVTATDRLGRLASAEPFISTLAAHIRYNGGSSLVFYAPCTDPGFPLADLVGGRPIKSIGPTYTTAANVSGPVGDDASYVRLFPTDDRFPAYFTVESLPITVTSGQTLALSAWFRNEAAPSFDDLIGRFFASLANASGSDLLMIEEDAVPVGMEAFGGSTSGYGVPATGRRMERDAWRLVTARLSLPSGVVDLWSGSDMLAQGTMTSIPGSISVTELIFGGSSYWGAVGHVQVYAGATNTFPYAQHLAQYQMGLIGLERQTTGDRIRTIAQYAGIPASQLTQIDTGSSVMQRARLAGLTPLDAMRDAERTEQGLLYCDGNGNLVFKDRRTLYNI